MSGICNILPAPPTPDNVPEFVPYACGQLMTPFTVRITTITKEEYVSKAGDTKPKKSKGLTHQNSQIMQGSLAKDDSVSVRSATDEVDDGGVFEAQAVVDTAGHLLEISVTHCHEVPRLFMKIISLCVPFNPSLNRITMSCGLTGATLYETVKILTISQITEVILDDSRIPEQNYYLLLEYQTHLQLLSLSRCNITDEDCALLFPKLEYPQPASKTLRMLYLMGNHISDEGARSIGHALRSNRSLVYLNLSGNKINDKGAAHIFRSLTEFHLTIAELKNKRKRTLNLIKMRKEAYAKCYNALAKAVLDKSEEHTQSVKRKSAKMGDVVPNLSNLNTDALALKAEKMASELIESYPDPFRVEDTVCRDNVVYSIGNLTLTYLNIAYNNLGYESVVKLEKVARYQVTVGRQSNLGLMNVQLAGNPVPVCYELERLSEMMTRAIQMRMMYSTPQGTGKRVPTRARVKSIQ